MARSGFSVTKAGPQPSFEENLVVVLTLGVHRAGGDVRPVGHPPADALQPREGGTFDYGLVD